MTRTIRVYDEDYNEVGTFPEAEYTVEVTPGNCLIFREKVGHGALRYEILDSIWKPECWNTVDISED